MASVTRASAAYRARRAATEARILAAAEQLLGEGARFTEIPVHQLLEVSGVSRAGFYANFADKSALLLALAREAIEEVTSTASSWWDTDYSAGPDGAAVAVRRLVAVYRRHATVLRTLDEVGAYDDTIANVWRERRAVYVRQRADGLRREMDAGVVAADLAVEVTVDSVVRMVETALLEHVTCGQERDDDLVAQTLARIGWLAYYGRVPDEVGRPVG